MEFKTVKKLIQPLIKKGHEWQTISINGVERRSKFYFSDIQWIILLLSLLILFKLTNGISKDIIGYVMSAFTISVSLFMSLLISIFDKFEKTNFKTDELGDEEIVRLIQKKNFFKRFISITSYLVVLSVIVIVLCSISYIFSLPEKNIKVDSLTLHIQEIDWVLTFKNSILILYRATLNYFLLDYLFLTFFITGSAFEYYMSEMDRQKIEKMK